MALRLAGSSTLVLPGGSAARDAKSQKASVADRRNLLCFSGIKGVWKTPIDLGGHLVHSVVDYCRLDCGLDYGKTDEGFRLWRADGHSGRNRGRDYRRLPHADARFFGTGRNDLHHHRCRDWSGDIDFDHSSGDRQTNRIEAA
jgi:hypothetical protein